MSTTEEIRIAVACMTMLGLFMTAYQLFQTRKLKRLELVRESWQSLWMDEKLMDLYYRIEYSEFKYSIDFHHSDDERLLDRLLGVFQMLALYYERGALTWADVMLMEYHIDRIVLNPEVQKYFEFLDGWAKNQKIESHAFTSAYNLASKYRKKSQKWG